MDYKISVIMPCYSVGITYVEEAIQSIEKQNYDNWEIIFIDDNSPFQEWRSEKLNSIPKNKLKIINNKERIGAGQSRNIGFNNSTGDLILYLDADDKYYSDDFFKYLIEKFNQNKKLDLICLNNLRFIDNKDLNKKLKRIKNQEFYFEKINFEIFNAKIYKTGVWLCLKRDFILKNNIKNLNKNSPHEDVCFMYQILWHRPNLLYTTTPFYLWRKRKNSTTGKLSNNKYYEITNINIILDDINELPLNKNYSDIYIYISRALLVSILKYGYKRNKKFLNININKKTYKKISNLAKNWDWPKINFINKFKLHWIVSLLYKVYYFLK